MTITRASYRIDSFILSRFNELFPSSTRGNVVQTLMEKPLGVQHNNNSREGGNPDRIALGSYLAWSVR